MKLVSFTYTKDSGDVSKRVLVEIAGPNPNHFGIDVTELSEEDQALVYAAITQAYDEYQTRLINILQDFDLNTNYRFFKPSGVSEYVRES